MAYSSFVLIALLFAFTGISAEEVYKVGGEKGWTILGNVNYSSWASSKKFKIGDKITFVYNKQFHNVMQVKRDDYHSCSASSPIKTYTSGNDTIDIKRKGHYFFICGVPGHCAAGQNVDIRIPKEKVGIISPASSASPSSSSPTTSPPPPLSVVAPGPSGSNAGVAAGRGLGLGLGLALVAVAAAAF